MADTTTPPLPTTPAPTPPPAPAPTISVPSGTASTTGPTADDGRLRGISRSIIIGVGGTGHQILLDVRKRLIEKYESLDKIPIVGFMLLDTDQSIFSKNPDYDDAVNLDNADKIHTSVHGVDNLRKNLREHPHLRTWLDARVLTGDIDQGAGAVRARGRLAYFWNYATIARKLEEEMLKVTRDSSKETAIRNGLQVGEGLTVYIVGSMLGGTGSGMFLDLAYTVRNKFKSQRMLEMVGMFSIPPNSEAVAVDNRPNAYAALMELNHFTDPSTTFSAQYQAEIPPMEDADPPFRYTYLVDTSSPSAQLDSVKDLVEMIGHSIFLDLTSEFQRQKKSNRNNFDQFLITADGLGCAQNYMGFGLASIYFPKDKVMTACSNRLAGDIVRRWTDPLERVVNIGAFTDQELSRLGLTVDAVERLVTTANSESGETLRDMAMGHWNSANRQYETAYPGHNRVVEYLVARQKESDARVADTDPNPDLLAKRKTNLGESVFQIQQNLGTGIKAKDKALRDWVSAQVNDPNHRHGVAAAALDTMADRFRTYITQMERKQEERKNGLQPTIQTRDAALQKINNYGRDIMLSFIATAKRREIDGEKDNFLAAARRYDAEMVDIRGGEAALVFYRHLLGTVMSLKAEMDRYVERIESLRAGFTRAERDAVQEPVDVNGEVLFNPGRRDTDPVTGADRYVGGDIDDRYTHYVGNALDANNATVNNLISDILESLGTKADIWGVRDGELPRIASTIIAHTRGVFKAVEEESVLDKFYSKYGQDTDRTIQTLRRVGSLSAPFLHLQENAPNYTHNINKEQTIIGVLHGAAPRTESEQRFRTMIMDTVQGVKDQQISNSNEPHQVLFLRERAAFPLRLLQGMESYRYAYDQVKSLGAAANPIHTRTDIKDWIRISPPSAEDQKSAWRTFVIGWASGVIDEEHESRYTSVGTRDIISFVANYTDKFGMPKSDSLGGFNTVESVVHGFKTDAGSAPGRPPAEARDLVQRLCDDRRMLAQINAAIDERLRAEGAAFLGARLVQHANNQKMVLAPSFYDPYYKVLTDYLEEINYAGGGQAPVTAIQTTSGVPAVIPATASPEPAPAAAPARATLKERLLETKELLDEGFITQEEYEARRQAILKEM
jgi:hypothetical protein